MSHVPQSAIKACLLVLEQNQRSFNGNISGCMYRHPDGLKCAIGHLIADEHYTPELEGKTIRSKLVSDALIASGVPKAEFDASFTMWVDIQYAHDHAKGDDFKKDFLAQIACHPKLHAAVLNELVMKGEPS